MTGRLLYPPADHHTQWVGAGSVVMPMDNVKWGVHDTETISWPSYDYYVNGVLYKMGSAPTLTYNPWTHLWRQHFWLNASARAFRNGPNGETVNREDVVQTEIVGYCDPVLVRKYGHGVTQIDQQAIDDLGDFGVFMHEDWGMDMDFYPEKLPWPPYDKGCLRMGWDRYQAWSGVLGHMAVPFNSHLDPGNLPMDKIRARMLGETKDPWPHLGDHTAAVATVQRKLELAGYYHGRDPDGTYGPFTRGGIRRLQLAQGWSGSGADGLIGPQTWDLIQALPDEPKAPPPPTPLQRWQAATGAAGKALAEATEAGDVAVKYRPGLQPVLDEQEHVHGLVAREWHTLHDAWAG